MSRRLDERRREIEGSEGINCDNSFVGWIHVGGLTASNVKVLIF